MLVGDLQLAVGFVFTEEGFALDALFDMLGA